MCQMCQILQSDRWLVLSLQLRRSPTHSIQQMLEVQGWIQSIIKWLVCAAQLCAITKLIDMSNLCFIVLFALVLSDMHPQTLCIVLIHRQGCQMHSMRE